jgi:site-specific recombinase XerD
VEWIHPKARKRVEVVSDLDPLSLFADGKASSVSLGAACRAGTAAPQHESVSPSVSIYRDTDGARTSRDLAIVGLMLLHGLRSCEVLALNREDIQFPDSQIRVPGKGKKIRMLPLDRDSVKLLDHYLCLERPPYCGQALFVCLKGPSRGNRITSAGLRSLFRHHRQTTGVTKANPHRAQRAPRHTFAADMLRAGVSLPALMQLMGHAQIQTTMVYRQLTPQDVWEQYARAISQDTDRRDKSESAELFRDRT